MSITGIGGSGSSYFQGQVMSRMQARGSFEKEPMAAGGKEKPDFAKLVSQLDANESGSLESEEIQSLVENISEATGMSDDLSAFLTTYDTDADEVLSSEEAIAALEANPRQGPPPPHGGRPEGVGESDMVNAIDSDGDGIIDTEEAQVLVDIVNQTTGSSLSVEDFMSQFDADEDETFTIEEAAAGMAAYRPKGPPAPPESSGMNTAAMDIYTAMSALGMEDKSAEDLLAMWSNSQESVNRTI
jgi:Ca2+-binding EF-hand superfamily protein